MSQVSIEQALQLAVEHHRAGRLLEAESIYRQILANQPAHPQSLQFLGVIAGQTGRGELAIDLLRQAIAASPENPDCHGNLGMVLFSQGRLDEAIACFQRAISLKPQFAEAHSNLGNAWKAKGQLDRAIVSFQQAISFNPGFAEAHYSLGVVLGEQGQIGQAIACYQRALALKPDYLEAHNNLGNALNMKGELDLAIDCCRRALMIKPDCVEAYNTLGSTWKNMGRLDDAIACLRRAIELKPDHSVVHSNLLCTLQYRSDSDSQSIFNESRDWNRRHAQAFHPRIQPHANDRNPERRLRIGYISPDFRNHPVGRFILPLLASHDRAAFEVYCYSQVATPDDLATKLRANADIWRTIVGLSDEQTAEAVRQDRIDILVDLAGHTAHNRLLVFARKPAPVQVTYLGYPGTTGLNTLDYRLTDGLADPPGLSDSFSSEQLIRLPQTAWCFQASDNAPPTAPLPALQNRRPTLGCFNDLAKLNDFTLKLWAEILHALPGARLILKAKGLNSTLAQQRIRQLMSESGINPDRLELYGWLRPADHLAMYGRIDIALDTYPYHGTTTTCEALWSGVPVVTLAGQRHASRVGVSLLTNVGLPEMIAQTTGEYIRIVSELAADLPRLAQLRSTLRQRMRESPLMDVHRFSRDIEDAYRMVWRNWCEK